RHTRLQGDWSSDVCSSDLFATTSSTLNEPSRTCVTLPPRKLGGTMIRCSTFFASWTVPTTSPGPTVWPSFAFGTKDHVFSRERRSEERRVGKEWRNGGCQE